MLLTFSILVTLLSSCATLPPVTQDFEAVRPVRPVLEAVTLVDPVPLELLRNYNAVILYSMDLEDYIKAITTPL
jgi:hypothetical protein